MKGRSSATVDVTLCVKIMEVAIHFTTENNNHNYANLPNYSDPLTDNVNQSPGLSPTTGNVGEVINSEGLLAQNKGSKMSSNLTVILFSGLTVALLTRILIYGAR